MLLTIPYKKGLKTIKWPGRLQKIYEKPTIYFDVAHNEESFLCYVKICAKFKFQR